MVLCGQVWSDRVSFNASIIVAIGCISLVSIITAFASPTPCAIMTIAEARAHLLMDVGKQLEGNSVFCPYTGTDPSEVSSLLLQL